MRRRFFLRFFLEFFRGLVIKAPWLSYRLSNSGVWELQKFIFIKKLVTANIFNLILQEICFTWFYLKYFYISIFTIWRPVSITRHMASEWNTFTTLLNKKARPVEPVNRVEYCSTSSCLITNKILFCYIFKKKFLA